MSWTARPASRSSTGQTRHPYRRLCPGLDSPSGGTGKLQRARQLFRQTGIAAAAPLGDLWQTVNITFLDARSPGRLGVPPPGRRCVTLGTDGFGRSDTRAALRRHFEVDAEAIVQAALAC
jgi:hypothetical protein